MKVVTVQVTRTTKHVLVREPWLSKASQSGPSRACSPCPDQPLQIGFDLQIPTRHWPDPPALHSGEASAEGGWPMAGQQPPELQIEVSSAARPRSTFARLRFARRSFRSSLRLSCKRSSGARFVATTARTPLAVVKTIASLSPCRTMRASSMVVSRPDRARFGQPGEVTFDAKHGCGRSRHRGRPSGVGADTAEHESDFRWTLTQGHTHPGLGATLGREPEVTSARELPRSFRGNAACWLCDGGRCRASRQSGVDACR